MKSARPISTTASKRLSTSLGNSYKAFPGSASSFGSPRSQSGSHSDVFKKPPTPNRTPKRLESTAKPQANNFGTEQYSPPSKLDSNVKEMELTSKYAMLEEQNLQIIDAYARLQKLSNDKDVEIERLKLQADAAELHKFELQDQLSDLEIQLLHYQRTVSNLTTDLDNSNMMLMSEQASAAAAKQDLEAKVIDLALLLAENKDSMNNTNGFLHESAEDFQVEHSHQSDEMIEELRKHLNEAINATHEAIIQVEDRDEKIDELTEQLTLKEQANHQLREHLDIMTRQVSALQEQHETLAATIESHDMDAELSDFKLTSGSIESKTPLSIFNTSNVHYNETLKPTKLNQLKSPSSSVHTTTLLANELTELDMDTKLAVELDKLYTHNLKLVRLFVTALDPISSCSISK
ncbi:hypothetical protein BDV3_003766 [Batrachochytrium dendrobatidis]|nr:hypothetical protein QVD99_004069 [Batrachochytrium dendrobatidis]